MLHLFNQLLILTISWIRAKLFELLKLNTLIVPGRGALPMGKKKGIITLSLVISRETARLKVTHEPFCVMNLKFLQVKTKLQVQVGEYIAWRVARGAHPVIFENVEKFVKHTKKVCIEDIRPDDIDGFFKELLIVQNSEYFRTIAMKDVRVMFRWFKARKYSVMDPSVIGEHGLTLHKEGDIIKSMNKPKRMGRPRLEPLIKLVKELRGNPKNPKMSYRDIARSVGRDPSQVVVWCNKTDLDN